MNAWHLPSARQIIHFLAVARGRQHAIVHRRRVMARWMKPEEQTPEVFVGDRIIGIVRDRKHATSKLLPRVVILEAIEGGWRDIEDSGYRLGDCELWTLESDLVHIADVVRR